MLVLFDSPAGHCLFKVLDPGILKKPDSIWDAFTSADSAKKMCAPTALARVARRADPARHGMRAG